MVTTSRGAIEGRVQALDHGDPTRVTLLETLHHRTVTCYLQSGDAERFRAVAGRRAIVEGTVTRHAHTGQPIAIRNIRRIVVLDESPPGAYRLARGVAGSSGAQLPEDAIRLLRQGR